MRELSIEEKAKRFDEAIEELRGLLEGVHEEKCEIMEEDIIKIFPELKESEDEKIRACIGMCLTDIDEQRFADFNTNLKACLAWLEKQGTSYTKRDVDDAYLKGVTDTKNEIEKQYEANYQIRKDIGTFIFNYRGDIKDRAKWMDYLGIKVSFVEKQGEQKQTVIIPRFRVGDVITSTKNAALKYNVKEVGILNELGEYDYVVEDVTDTDYKGRIHKMSISKVDEWGLLVDDKPQGKSAIEAIKEEKVDNANKVEQKSAWSEEDEEMLNSFLHKLEVCDLLSNKEGIWIKNKLKALKQNTWKPSEEQIKAVKEAACYSSVFSEKTIDNLISLSKQLKKLREEQL